MACGDSGGSGGSAPGTPLPNPGPELPTSTEGWTEFTASADTLTIYVSSSTGNDANDGLSPATPKATLNAGKALLRTGMPDWLLLKAGDIWTNQNFGNFTKSGRGPLEPMLISSYDTGARPLVRTGTDNALVMQTTAVSHVAVVGLHFVAHTYTGSEGSTGIRLLTTCDNILFEDLFVEGYKDNFVLQADAGFGTISDIRLRRCVVVDAYSGTSSHAQGFYGSRVDGLLIEECTFDHNGWGEDGSGGGPEACVLRRPAGLGWRHDRRQPLPAPAAGVRHVRDPPGRRNRVADHDPEQHLLRPERQEHRGRRDQLGDGDLGHRQPLPGSDRRIPDGRA